MMFNAGPGVHWRGRFSGQAIDARLFIFTPPREAVQCLGEAQAHCPGFIARGMAHEANPAPHAFKG